MSRLLFYTIIVILLFSIYGSFSLSIADFNTKNVCPKLLGIPACYIVLLFFVLILLSHIFQSYMGTRLWYYVFLTVPLLLALSGTITELSGKVICPRTSGGTPMCYISLGICMLLLILKIIEKSLSNFETNL